MFHSSFSACMWALRNWGSPEFPSRYLLLHVRRGTQAEYIEAPAGSSGNADHAARCSPVMLPGRFPQSVCKASLSQTCSCPLAHSNLLLRKSLCLTHRPFLGASSVQGLGRYYMLRSHRMWLDRHNWWCTSFHHQVKLLNLVAVVLFLTAFCHEPSLPTMISNRTLIFQSKGEHLRDWWPNHITAF